MEHHFSCQWISKESWDSNSYIRQLEFKPKTVITDPEGHYIILKGSIQQENLTIINIYAPNMGATNYISHLLTKIKNQIENNTLIVGDFNTPLLALDRSSKQKINK